MKSFLNNHKVRGLRNNNPGNLVYTSIKWQGKVPKSQNTDTRFEQFTNLKDGIRASIKDLIHDINKGKNTVSLLISEYAPSNENDTKAYIDSVCKTIGVTSNEKLTQINEQFLLKLTRAIYKVELGTANKDVLDADIMAAIKDLGNVSTSTLKVLINANFFFKNKMKEFFTTHKKTIHIILVSALVGVGIFYTWKHYQNAKAKK